MTACGCGAPLRKAVTSGVEMQGNRIVEKIVAIELDSGRCGDPDGAGGNRFCCWRCYMRWQIAGKVT